jgi:glycosyltransferase involved in cell wall biosynthesis
MAQAKITLVVPLFNEANRWNQAYWQELSELDEISWLFVDDGSSDTTAELVEPLVAAGRCSLLRLPENQGKANAVRSGLLAALDEQPDAVGFLDGDGAFDKRDIESICATFGDNCLPTDSAGDVTAVFESVWASRVALAGRDIQRRASRHYLGRIIATLISPGLPGVPYDTQCGFKIFRSSQTLGTCLATPFSTRWFFDVELLQRWLIASGSPMKIWEVPLLHWRDVPGSKISNKQASRIAREIALIARTNRRLPG